MGCESVFMSLGSVNNGVLQTANPLDTSLQSVIDQLGTVSALKLSTKSVGFFGAVLGTSGIGMIAGSMAAGKVGFWRSDVTPSANNYNLAFENDDNMFLNHGNGLYFRLTNNDYGKYNTSGWVFFNSSVTQNGFVTIKGTGGNILDLRSSANVEKGYIDDSGNFFTAGYANIGGNLYFGGLGVGNPMLKPNGANIEAKLGDDSALTNLSANNLDGQTFSSNSTPGVSGTFLQQTGGTITVTNGLITGIT